MSTASCATVPSARIDFTDVSSSSSAARYWLQVLISTGSGLLSGGRHFTALVMRTPRSVSPSLRSLEVGARRQSEREQRLIEKYAGVVPRERPARAIRAMHAGREAHDQQLRVGLTERRHGLAVVVGIGVRGFREKRCEPRTQRAVRTKSRGHGPS